MFMADKYNDSELVIDESIQVVHASERVVVAASAVHARMVDESHLQTVRRVTNG